jgi:hypothetical protein
MLSILKYRQHTTSIGMSCNAEFPLRNADSEPVASGKSMDASPTWTMYTTIDSIR